MMQKILTFTPWKHRIKTFSEIVTISEFVSQSREDFGDCPDLCPETENKPSPLGWWEFCTFASPMFQFHQQRLVRFYDSYQSTNGQLGTIICSIISMSIWIFNIVRLGYSNYIKDLSSTLLHLSFCFGIFRCFPGRGATGPTGVATCGMCNVCNVTPAAYLWRQPIAPRAGEGESMMEVVSMMVAGNDGEQKQPIGDSKHDGILLGVGKNGTSHNNDCWVKLTFLALRMVTLNNFKSVGWEVASLNNKSSWAA